MFEESADVVMVVNWIGTLRHQLFTGFTNGNNFFGQFNLGMVL